MRHGTTLVELAVALVVFGLVSALIARSAAAHERLQRALQAATTGARAQRQALAILSAVLREAAPADLVRAGASDSAVEVMARIGGGIGCVVPGAVYVPPDFMGAAVAPASFLITPHPGDRLVVFDDHSGPGRWIDRTIVSTASGGSGCDGAANARGTTLVLDSAVDAGPVAAFVVTRRTRFDLYRSGNGQWYLGMREWTPTRSAFNGVQPVAGPLHAYSVRRTRTGLRFAWLDSAGIEHATPFPPDVRVAAVEITARSTATAVAPGRRVVAFRRVP